MNTSTRESIVSNHVQEKEVKHELHTVWIKGLEPSSGSLPEDKYLIRLLVEPSGKDQVDLGVIDGQIIKKGDKWIPMGDDFWSYPGTIKKVSDQEEEQTVERTRGNGIQTRSSNTSEEQTNLIFEVYTKEKKGISETRSSVYDVYGYHFLTKFELKSEHKTDGQPVDDFGMGYKLTVEIQTDKDAIALCKAWKEVDEIQTEEKEGKAGKQKGKAGKKKYKLDVEVEEDSMMNIRRVRWGKKNLLFHHYHEFILRQTPQGPSEKGQRCLIDVGVYGGNTHVGVIASPATYRSPDPLLAVRRKEINSMYDDLKKDQNTHNFAVKVASKYAKGFPFRASWFLENLDGRQFWPHQQAILQSRPIINHSEEIKTILNPSEYGSKNTVKEIRGSGGTYLRGKFPQEWYFCLGPPIPRKCRNCVTQSQRNMRDYTMQNSEGLLVMSRSR